VIRDTSNAHCNFITVILFIIYIFYAYQQNVTHIVVLHIQTKNILK